MEKFRAFLNGIAGFYYSLITFWRRIKPGGELAEKFFSTFELGEQNFKPAYRPPLTFQQIYHRRMRASIRQDKETMPRQVKRLAFELAAGSILVPALCLWLYAHHPLLLELSGALAIAGIGATIYKSPSGSRFGKNRYIYQALEAGGFATTLGGLTMVLAVLRFPYTKPAFVSGVLVYSWIFATRHYPQKVFGAADTFTEWAMRFANWLAWFIVQSTKVGCEFLLLTIHLLAHRDHETEPNLSSKRVTE